MRAVRREEMIAIDREAIDVHGIPGLALMEEAGNSVANLIFRLAKKKPTPVTVVCGSGNNGGDGFVAARLLKKAGVPIQTILLTSPASLKGDAEKVFKKFKAEGGRVQEVLLKSEKPKKNEIDRALRPLREGLKSSPLVVDAIFGTGLTRRQRSPDEELSLAFHAIRLINQFETKGRCVISIDIPSGLDANNGLPIENKDDLVIHAHYTVTMGLPKFGCLIDPGCRYVGELIVADLSFPKDLLEIKNPRHQLIEPREFREHLPKRDLGSHKGSFGHVLIIGGSRNMPGALSLALDGALRGGTGKVSAIVPGEQMSFSLAKEHSEAMWFPVAVDDDGFFHRDSHKEIREILKKFSGTQHAVVFGPGVGMGEGSQKILDTLLSLWREEDKNFPLVLDADALNLLAKEIHSENKSLSFPEKIPPPFPWCLRLIPENWLVS